MGIAERFDRAGASPLAGIPLGNFGKFVACFTARDPLCHFQRASATPEPLGDLVDFSLLMPEAVWDFIFAEEKRLDAMGLSKKATAIQIIALLKDGLKYYPDHPLMNAELGVKLHLRLGRYEEAIPYLENARRLRKEIQARGEDLHPLFPQNIGMHLRHAKKNVANGMTEKPAYRM